MTKSDFLSSLERGLSHLPQKDWEERLTFYSEMIDDRMDDGIPEEKAVEEIGFVEDVIMQILQDYPQKSKRKLGAWEITLMILGFPLWLPLLIAAAAVVLSVYIVLWSAAISVWAAEVSLWGCVLGGLVCAGMSDSLPTGFALFGASLICAGLSVFLFYGCKYVTKAMVFLTKAIWGFIVKQMPKGRN